MVPAERATIAFDDAGLQHGVGLFETMFARQGRVFRLAAHVNRLSDSARILGLAKSLDVAAMQQAVQTTLDHNKLQEARVRLTVTGGVISLLKQDPEKSDVQPTVLVVASEPTVYDPRYFEDGVMVVLAMPAANPFDPMAGHKTLDYWLRLRTLRQAAAAGAGEAIWLNVSNHLASGAVSNVFLVKDGGLWTPFARGEEVQGALAAPVLPGITRQAVIELADRMKIPVQRRMLSVNDLLEADEVFLTNSSWHILPVSRVEKKDIGTGKAGEVTRRLRTALLELIDVETRPPTQQK
jgi:branched-subunit amino acid aminotransferase/4-amino-4-deoxychorismate lyase